MSEAGVVAEYWGLRRSELWPDHGAPDGTGQAALLIGGFGITPRTLGPLARWLGGAGWVVRTADLGSNTGCGTATVRTVITELDEIARHHGPAVVIGHSRGGLIGRVAAVRAPELVRSLTTVCTPWTIGPPDRPGVAMTSRLIKGARRRGLDVMGSIECADGPCCTTFRRQMTDVPAPRWTAIRSTADRIAGDDALVRGADRELVIATSHLGAVLSLQGWRAIGQALS